MTPAVKKPSKRNALQSRAIVSAFGPFNLTAHWKHSVPISAGEVLFYTTLFSLSFFRAENSFFYQTLQHRALTLREGLVRISEPDSFSQPASGHK